MAAAERVLVTGATGYIAAHIVQQLLQEGYVVRGTVRALGSAKCEPIRKIGEDSGGTLELVEADLLDDGSWSAAVQDCKFVMHTASPFPKEDPAHEDELIKPAVDGTLRVLRAAAAAGVQRVVLTSSVAAIHGSGGPAGKVYSEADWTDPNTAGAYSKSKTLAEKAAWDFVTQEDVNLELVCMNPCLVVGPMLTSTLTTSGEIPKRLLTRAMPALPELHFCYVDVRDVARAHVLGMTSATAVGNRYVLAGSDHWLKEVGEALSAEFAPMGYNVPTMHLPYAGLWIASWFDASISMILGGVGKATLLDNSKATQELGVQFRPCLPSLVELAHSLVENNIVERKPGYTSRL